MSPGPDFIMAVRNSLVSRRSGIFTSIGLGFGIMVHVSYCLLGVGFIVSQSILLFNFLKIFAALYLIYIGWKSWNSGVSESKDIEKQKVKLSNLESLRIGFLTNVFNPKVTLFFLGLFTIGVQPGTPLFPQIIFGLVVSFGTMAWFSLVALFFSTGRVQRIYHKSQKVINRIFGGLLIALGIRIAMVQR